MYSRGKEIVAIRDHPNKVFKRGEIFLIRATRKPACSCMAFLIDIGKPAVATHLICIVCKKRYKNNTPIWWFSNWHFAPLASKVGQLVLERYGDLVLVENALP